MLKSSQIRITNFFLRFSFAMFCVILFFLFGFSIARFVHVTKFQTHKKKHAPRKNKRQTKCVFIENSLLFHCFNEGQLAKIMTIFKVLFFCFFLRVFSFSVGTCVCGIGSDRFVKEQRMSLTNKTHTLRVGV